MNFELYSTFINRPPLKQITTLLTRIKAVNFVVVYSQKLNTRKQYSELFLTLMSKYQITVDDAKQWQFQIGVTVI